MGLEMGKSSLPSSSRGKEEADRETLRRAKRVFISWEIDTLGLSNTRSVTMNKVQPCINASDGIARYGGGL